MISVLILTLDEEINIAECISSLPWRDDVHVVDSGSTDRTVEIAKEMGANVRVRPFANYADQRNFGFGLDFKHDWIVTLDADERVTPGLIEEIERTVRTVPAETTMFYVRRKDFIGKKWLKRASGYPLWVPRLFRRGHVTVTREVNEQFLTDGKIGRLTEHLLHYPLNKGVEWWFARHNRYSTLEANLVLAEHMGKNGWHAIFSDDPVKRRVALKELSFRLPGRPFLAFFYLYIWRGGFLDGQAGWCYSLMRMSYEVMIDSKIAAARCNKCRK